MEPAVPVIIAGLPLKCPHCGNDRFFEESWMLDSSSFNPMGLGLFSSEASNYVCSRCSRIEWFLEPSGKRGDAEDEENEDAEEAEEEIPPEQDVECLACRAIIPAGQSSCPACGWSYR